MTFVKFVRKFLTLEIHICTHFPDWIPETFLAAFAAEDNAIYIHWWRPWDVIHEFIHWIGYQIGGREHWLHMWLDGSDHWVEYPVPSTDKPEEPKEPAYPTFPAEWDDEFRPLD